MNIPRFRIALASALVVMAFGHVPTSAQVTSQRIARSDSEPANWLTYSGNYQSQRFSPLNQITRQNVGQLKPLWMY